jgi:hypothetical protein
MGIALRLSGLLQVPSLLFGAANHSCAQKVTYLYFELGGMTRAEGIYQILLVSVPGPAGEEGRQVVLVDL